MAHAVTERPGRLELRQLGRELAYAGALASVGATVIVCAVTQQRRDAAFERWRRLTAYRQREGPRLLRLRHPGSGMSVLHGVVSLSLGLLSLFLLVLWATAIVRGPFYGLVESGPVEPGTWGGPTLAGAWAVHAAAALPIVLAFPFLIRGIGALHVATTRWLYGDAVRWCVLPATASLAVAGALVMVAWSRQV